MECLRSYLTVRSCHCVLRFCVGSSLWLDGETPFSRPISVPNFNPETAFISIGPAFDHASLMALLFSTSYAFAPSRLSLIWIESTTSTETLAKLSRFSSAQVLKVPFTFLRLTYSGPLWRYNLMEDLYSPICQPALGWNSHATSLS